MGYYSSEFLFPLELVWNFTKCKHNMGYYSSESWISMGLESAFADYYKGRMPFWWCISYNPNITWDIIQDNPDKPWSKYNFIYNDKFTAQARISMAKHRVTASRMINYLARYIHYSLVTVSLEYRLISWG